MKELTDYIVIGSGCTGSMAAQTLVEAGAGVLMLDAAVGTDTISPLIPDKSYIDIRNSDPEQYRYFIGDKQEGIPWGKVRSGEHFTPPRKYILEKTDEYLPLTNSAFSPLESLAYGGLGNAWGLGCCEFSDRELIAAGLNPAAMEDAYNIVGNRIGISAASDDASPYTTGKFTNFQPALLMDKNQSLLFEKYNLNRQKINSAGFYMGRTALALLTEDFKNRKGYAYRDMDFYSDHNKSAFRPGMIVDELKKQPNFSYQGGFLVTHFVEKPGFVEVYCLNLETQQTQIFSCKKLVMASGVLGTARIVLRSSGTAATLPLLCNSYAYVPCVHLAMTGKGIESKKPGFSQLSIFHDEAGNNFDVAMASIYSYQSLMLFRLIKETPLNFVDANLIMRYLMPGLVIMGIHHPAERTCSKYLELEKRNDSPTGDALKVTYSLTANEQAKINLIEKKYIRTMRSMGVYAIKRIHPGHGSSVHYAGTMPFSKENLPFRILPNSKLGQTNNVYIADGSGFDYLPAKGLTFSLMANAHLAAKNALQND